MYLKNISIENFKGIEQMELKFQSGVNLLIGDNGAGKSSVLDAIVIALGGYMDGAGGKSRGITDDDIRIVIHNITGHSNAIEYRVPMKITGNFSVSEKVIPFSLKKFDLDAVEESLVEETELEEYASRITNDISSFLPIFSYQSTHRERVNVINYNKNKSDYQNKENSSKIRNKRISDRREGYLNCMNGSPNIINITRWCMNMEIMAFKENTLIPEYETFKRIVAVFMQYMNELETLPEISYERQLDEICYTENQNTLPISKLSAGYQSILFMMLDIAYRLAVLNPAFENAQDAEGIILIDEIDLHLHPKWQWNVLNALEKTLPNVQFIIATHSPIVISSCKDENLIMLDENQNVRYLENAYAYSIKDILELRQESYSIPKKLQQLSSLFENYLNDENYAKAKEILEEMTAQFGENNSEVVQARWLLNLEE